jgi:hypothetical protein
MHPSGRFVCPQLPVLHAPKRQICTHVMHEDFYARSWKFFYALIWQFFMPIFRCTFLCTESPFSFSYAWTLVNHFSVQCQEHLCTLVQGCIQAGGSTCIFMSFPYQTILTPLPVQT